LGVAVIGSLVASVYAHRIDDLRETFALGPQSLAAARSSLGEALQTAPSLGERAGQFSLAVREGFVDGLSVGLRVSAALMLVAAVVAYRFLPARAGAPTRAHAQEVGDAVAIAD